MSADLRTYYDRKALEIDELAATYNSPIPYKRFFYRRRFEAVMALLDPRPGERILELGCGSGFYTKPLIESGAVVTASDLAANYVAQAQQHVGSRRKRPSGSKTSKGSRSRTVSSTRS
jgi:2-polyprenyl-3-methyl-5-hydroxy-6-metoxy-1,4-benzoquinol methylase